jgi:hypothetical protein
MKISRIILAGAVKACIDDFAYCPAQKGLCGREEYPAVAAYCKKTCGTCTEEFEMPTSSPVTNKARLIGPSCEDKSWCNAATCLMPEFVDDCPIACGLSRCNDQEHQQGSISFCYSNKTYNNISNLSSNKKHLVVNLIFHSDFGK